jgi:hypothetical protein
MDYVLCLIGVEGRCRCGRRSYCSCKRGGEEAVGRHKQLRVLVTDEGSES